jgi:hypothetical protein
MDTALVCRKKCEEVFNMGIVGLIFGILSVIGSFIPAIGPFISRPGAALAILLSGFALAGAIKEKQPIGGAAIVGLAFGIALL